MADVARRVLDAVEQSTAGMLLEVADLVRVPSVSGTDAENEAQALLAARLDRTGYDVDHWRLDLDDLRAQPDFPGMEVERAEAWGLVGRGACDMKAGLVAAMAAVDAIRSAGVWLRGDVLVASVQGEEDGGLGTFALLQRGWRADACVIAEPTDLDVIPANSGALTFRLRVHGQATHAARRTEGVSAVEKFWPVWKALQELEARRHLTVDPLMDRWPLAHPLSIGSVSAGDWASSVPDLLVAEGRIGVALDEPMADTRAALEETVAEVNATDPWFRDHPVEVEWWGGQFASGRLPADSDLAARVQAAHLATAGVGALAPDVYGAPYGSDLRLLTGLGGIPTVQYGPGDVRLAHGPQEAVVVADVVATARTLALLVLDVCG